MFGGFLFLSDGAQDVAGTGDMREVDLGLDFGLAMSRVGRLVSGGGLAAVGAKTLADQVGFVFFERTGMRFLLGNAHFRQNVKNFLALDFQLTGQIIDSNLHPLSSLPFRTAQFEL